MDTNELGVQVNDIKCVILDMINSEYNIHSVCGTSSSFSYTHDIDSQLSSIERAQSHIDQSTDSSTIAAEINTLRDILNTKKELNLFDAYLDKGDVLSSTKCIISLRRLLLKMSTWKMSWSASVLALLSTQIKKKNNRLSNRLEEMKCAAFRFSEGELVVKKELVGVFGHVHYDSPLPLSVILESWFKLHDNNNTMLQSFSTSFIDCIIKNIVHSYHTKVQVMSTTNQLVLLRVGPTPQTNGSPSVEDILDRVVLTLTFVFEHVFASKQGGMSILGAVMSKSLWDEINPCIKAITVRRDCDVKSLTDNVTSFLHRLASIGFISMSSISNSPLLKYVKSIDSSIMKDNLAVVLVELKSMIHAYDLHLIEVVEEREVYKLSSIPPVKDVYTPLSKLCLQYEPLLFQVHKSMITSTASHMVSLLNNSDAKGIKHILDMFILLVPATHDVNNDERKALLYYNDCMYIAHHLVIMGKAAKVSSYVQYIGRYRLEGERVLLHLVNDEKSKHGLVTKEYILNLKKRVVSTWRSILSDNDWNNVVSILYTNLLQNTKDPNMKSYIKDDLRSFYSNEQEKQKYIPMFD